MHYFNLLSTVEPEQNGILRSSFSISRKRGNDTNAKRLVLILTGSIKGFHTVGDFGIDSLDIV